jgi:putative DNA primase/helicase
LLARGYFLLPQSGLDAVQQLEDLASPISAFIRDYCVVDSTESVKVDALWTAWKTWCVDDNRHTGTKELFGRDLRAALPTLKKRRPRTGEGERDHVYQGLALVGTTLAGTR